MNTTVALEHFPQVVFTNKAQCRDCCRCVRVCPVKAIRMESGQAQVVGDRCIACGTCVRECPQSAKAYRNDLEEAVRLLRLDRRSACSIAPSFAGLYPPWMRRRLPSALRRLGFSHVGETAVGAWSVAQATATHVESGPGRRHICSACPAVVRYVERYEPERLDELVPIVSPMIAHARSIRERCGDETTVVFIGPCIAKKAEAARYAGTDGVDCVLTFDELTQWLQREGIDPAECEESDFDEQPLGDARLFPLEGGAVKTSGWSAELLSRDVLAVSGFGAVRNAVQDDLAGEVIEPLMCEYGCAGGPATGQETGSGFASRSKILKYAEETVEPVETTEQVAKVLPLQARFYREKSDPGKIVPSEEKIRSVLEQTGKASEESRLNCGACGYSTCRDKAIAVIEGLAEPEMCMPYMKRLAEQRVDRIIETSPNGIVILDEELKILSMNPAFRSFFTCSNAVCGKLISYLMDPGPFERLTSGDEELVDETNEHPAYNLVCHEILYPLREERQYVGIFVNMTKTRSSQQRLEELRGTTLNQARELLEQQVEMAETIASCLGRNTARAESLLENLMSQARSRT